MIYRDPEKPSPRLQAPRLEEVAVALASLEKGSPDPGIADATAPGQENNPDPGLLAVGGPAAAGANPPGQGSSPGQSQFPGQGQPLTLAAHSQALIREAVINGSVNHILGELRGWIEKIRTFLLYADTGIETTNNIVNVAKGTLEKELGLSPASPEAGAASMQLPASSLQLIWNLFRTPEFQQFTGRMLAQVLKAGFTPPVQTATPGTDSIMPGQGESSG
ncbi:MAG: hypothetical protein PWQ18_446 [Clostridia bacterium]|nr:hypothetical protein [Clostridia bacterium]